MPSVAVVWTPHARACLLKLYAFLAEKDADAARRAMGLIQGKARLLAGFPNAGRPAADLEPEHRELPVPFGASGYVLLYSYNPDSGVAVLAVRHQFEVDF